MEIDKDILNDFKRSIIDVEKNTKKIADELIKSNLKEKLLFEEFGINIDRLYEAADTLGMTEIADYCKMMKELTYKCGESDNEKGIEKCMKMMLDCVQILAKLPKCLEDREELKKIRYTMQVEGSKGEQLSRSYFFSIKRTSCD